MELRRNISAELAAELKQLAIEARLAKEKPNILIVEDAHDDALLLKLQLVNLHCEIHIVESADAAIALLKQKIFSLVFLDLKLPVRGGVDVLRYLKMNQPHVPIIVVSGNLDGDLFDKAKTLGYFGIIEKPLDRKTIEQIFIQHGIPI